MVPLARAELYKNIVMFIIVSRTKRSINFNYSLVKNINIFLIATSYVSSCVEKNLLAPLLNKKLKLLLASAEDF